MASNFGSERGGGRQSKILGNCRNGWVEKSLQSQWVSSSLPWEFSQTGSLVARSVLPPCLLPLPLSGAVRAGEGRWRAKAVHTGLNNISRYATDMAAGASGSGWFGLYLQPSLISAT